MESTTSPEAAAAVLAQDNKKWRNVYVALVCLFACLAAAFFFTYSAIVKQQRFLIECTTPGKVVTTDASGNVSTGHKCYDDANAKTGKYLQYLNATTIAVNECGRSHNGQLSDNDFLLCVRGRTNAAVTP